MGAERPLQPVQLGARPAVHESRGHHARVPASRRGRPSSTTCARWRKKCSASSTCTASACIEIVREKSRRREDWSACFRRRYRPGRSVDWDYQQRSRFNRRIHTLTDIKMSGPAAGTPYLITKYSPNGTRTRGTVNNCANGYTPWGTYLTCEENFAGYFRRVTATDNPKRTAEGTGRVRALRRRGQWPRAVGHGDSRYRGQHLRPLEHREARRLGRTAATTIAMSSTPTAGWSRSIRSIRAPRRRSAPRWAASRTKARSSAR